MANAGGRQAAGGVGQAFGAKPTSAGKEAKDVRQQYIFLNIIGSGSFGKVHKVQSRTNGRIFACKEIDYAKMSEKEKKLLVHEVNTLKELSHENIVSYIDRFVERENAKMFIVMEYCENGDLARYIKRHKTDRRYIAEEKIWSVFVQLLHALNYCHSLHKHDDTGTHKVIHRDIKPGNVFLTRDGSIKLGDFGLCRSLGELSQAKTNVGTPLYMAIEVLQKQSYTEKADIWSLGCVIYELCALQPPFVASNMDSLKAKVKQGARPAIPAHYSSDLSAVIDSMLNSNFNSRPSAAELLNHRKIIEMSERMKNAGMTGAGMQAAANPPPPVQAPVSAAAPRAGEALAALKNEAANIGNPVDVAQKERELKEWEERLQQREQQIRAREEQVERALVSGKSNGGAYKYKM
ncbi:Kinase, NEK [Giardia duodenalis]|uniref:non-specific serine/threonine protein kinase n=2 Tax=Giardia intestinalis TaxID=5741 RepID=A8BJT1_GIAIC|nr:Kinase, NEK [Giardia intestinalis]ESU36847.1 Serine/threonine-protein kinase NEK [Giardia intestinalis]KAE8303948.1 Kinase, NEK [Giardia intestinalis]|eukprot:XP_001706649.1 Kinase, NEK [Giardia lamblia ATCC 50803]